MAFIDDNNSGIAAGAGKNPLEDLDRELEELKIRLGEIDEEPAEQPEKEAEQAPSPAPALSKPEKEDPAPVRREPSHTAEPQKSPRTGVILAALAIALIGIAAGLIVFFLNRAPQAEPEPTEAPTVTVNDSVLGTIALQPPEDASVNTYSTANLVPGDDGYYAYYIDGVKTSEMGVDLSEYQGEIDFEAVKAAGIDFVMLRIGGRYYGTEGRMYSDDAFADYYTQAKAVGLKVGVYFFSQAASEEDSIEEARYTLELLDGRALDYPVAIDWETIDDDDARTDDVTGEMLTRIAAAFCDTVEAAGYRSVVYASTSLILQSYDFETMKSYDFWLADYRQFPEQEKMYYHFTMWQYSTKGVVPGIDAEVDLNLCLNAAGM